MRVLLTRKLAEALDGVDLSTHETGDVLTLSRREAELLVAEGWASPLGPPSVHDAVLRTAVLESPYGHVLANRQRLRQLARAIEQRRFEPHGYRRAEDRIRDELQDAYARIIRPSVRVTATVVPPKPRRTQLPRIGRPRDNLSR